MKLSDLEAVEDLQLDLERFHRLVKFLSDQFAGTNGPDRSVQIETRDNEKREFEYFSEPAFLSIILGAAKKEIESIHKRLQELGVQL